jgi:hypothetical protein
MRFLETARGVLPLAMAMVVSPTYSLLWKPANPGVHSPPHCPMHVCVCVDAIVGLINTISEMVQRFSLTLTAVGGLITVKAMVRRCR